MRRVRSGTGNQFYLPARIASIFRFAAGRNHAKLFNGIGIIGSEREAQAGRRRVVHVDAVQSAVVAALAESIDVRKAGVGAGVRAVLRDLDARLENGQGERSSR